MHGNKVDGYAFQMTFLMVSSFVMHIRTIVKFMGKSHIAI